MNEEQEFGCDPYRKERRSITVRLLLPLVKEEAFAINNGSKFSRRVLYFTYVVVPETQAAIDRCGLFPRSGFSNVLRYLIWMSGKYRIVGAVRVSRGRRSVGRPLSKGQDLYSFRATE